MKKGKYQKTSSWRKTGGRKFTLLMCVALVLVATVGGTLAFLITNSMTVDNQFVPGVVECTANSDGTITINANTNVPVYIRASYAVNYYDDDGNIVFQGNVPEAVVSPMWVCPNNDGIWYYKGIIYPSSEDQAVTFINTWTEGSVLEVAAEAIQAEGTTDVGDEAAIENAWDYAPPISG